MKHERKELIQYRMSNGEEKLRSAKIFIEETRRVIERLEDRCDTS